MSAITQYNVHGNGRRTRSYRIRNTIETPSKPFLYELEHGFQQYSRVSLHYFVPIVFEIIGHRLHKQKFKYIVSLFCSYIKIITCERSDITDGCALSTVYFPQNTIYCSLLSSHYFISSNPQIFIFGTRTLKST